MLIINEDGVNTKVVHTEPALPANTLVPSKREAIAALGQLQRLSQSSARGLLVDGKVLSKASMFNVLRCFILTR